MSEGNKIWTAILVFLVASEFSVFMVFYNSVLKAKLFAQLVTKSNEGVERAIGVAMLVTELSLSLSLVVLLQRKRSGGFSTTDSVIKLIIAFTIGTSLLCALLGPVILILVIVAPHSFAWLALGLLIPNSEYEALIRSSKSRSECCLVYINCMFVS